MATSMTVGRNGDHRNADAALRPVAHQLKSVTTRNLDALESFFSGPGKEHHATDPAHRNHQNLLTSTVFA